jgi:uncharacterized membrane protein HdeD (DUF308 family)
VNSPFVSDRRLVLRDFYFLRAAVAFAWVAIVFLSRSASPLALGALLVVYPAWDAIANLLDARRNGGLRANPGQRLNAIISVVTAVAIAVAYGLKGNIGGVAVFGAWALFAGLLQLAVGIWRRKLGGQAFMMLSGAQSALAGVIFTMQAFGKTPDIVQLAPYAAFGGVYFLASALWLMFRKAPAVAYVA